jgi:hypothetical protein
VRRAGFLPHVPTPDGGAPRLTRGYRYGSPPGKNTNYPCLPDEHTGSPLPNEQLSHHTSYILTFAFPFSTFNAQFSTNKEKGRQIATDDKKKKEELITSSPLSMNNE